MPPGQIMVKRRQGSIPPTPSTRPTSGSSAPKIGGSEAAFIVVVIALAAIVILASIAIYCLLRKGEPSAAERAARRKYSIRGRGMRTHPLPIGLPGSLSEKIGSVFKGRRTGLGWVPAHDEADEWDSTDEPQRVHYHHHHHHDLPYDGQQHQREAYPRVGSAPPSHRATLTEASESLHTSRMASRVEDPSEEDFDGDGPSIVHIQAPSGPDEVWLNARDGTGRGGLGSVGTANDTIPMGYYAPQPRRADSGPEIPLFAGSTPFRHDI